MNIVTSVEFDALLERVRALQDEVGELVLARDVLLFDVRPRLESRYWSVIGVVESATLELELEVLRLRRKLELLQAADNREEEPDAVQIENALDRELQEFAAQVDVAKTKVEEALAFASNSALLSTETTKRLRELYLKLVKTLHPDVAPNAGPDAALKLKAAVEAYKRSDLTALEALSLAVEALADDSAAPEKNAFDELLDRETTLQKSRDELKTRIEKIRAEFPFNVADLLDDSEAVRKRLEEIRQKQLELKTLRDRYQQRVEEILRKWEI